MNHFSNLLIDEKLLSIMAILFVIQVSSQDKLAQGKNYQWVAVGSYKIGINAEL